MTQTHPIEDYCLGKGKAVEFVPGSSGTLFDEANGHIRHLFEYRGEQRQVLAPLQSDLPLQKAWNRLLYHIRKEKQYVDELWEHGSPL